MNPSFASPSPVLGMTNGTQPAVHAGYGVSLTDIDRYEQAMQSAQMRLEAQNTARTTQQSAAITYSVRALEGVDAEMRKTKKMTQDFVDGRFDGPDAFAHTIDLVQQAGIFGVRTTLTISIVNKLTEGVGQLFRQQA